jgi:hypothetical protein
VCGLAYIALLLSTDNNVLVGARQALGSQTDGFLSPLQLIFREAHLFNLAGGSSSARKEIQVENPPRSGKEVESTCIWTIQTREYAIILHCQPN